MQRLAYDDVFLILSPADAATAIWVMVVTACRDGFNVNR